MSPLTGSTRSILEHLKKKATIRELTLSKNETTLDFTGLDINKDKIYELICTITDAVGTGPTMLIYVEGDYDDANYYIQMHSAEGATHGVGTVSAPRLGYLDRDDTTLIRAILTRDSKGYFRYISNATKLALPTAVNIYNYCGASKVPFDNITQIRIASDLAGGIGKGSYFLLRGMRD